MIDMNYRMIRSNRKTFRISIAAAGTVELYCPLRTTREQAEEVLRKHSRWIEKQLQKQQTASRLPSLSPKELSELVSRAKQVYPQRAAHFARILGVTYGRITVRMQKTRWGSCSAEGNLNFNVLLLLAPEAVVDYVVVHELCHRKFMNHSADFWNCVAEVMPDYKAQKKWLKDNGAALMSRVPEK